MLSGADAKDGVVLEQCAIGSAEMPPSASCSPTVAEEGFRLWEECLSEAKSPHLTTVQYQQGIDLWSSSGVALCLHPGVVVSTVLAVDSEPDLLVTYYRLLTRQGYRVITAPSRTRGLLALNREPPALVIVTLSLRDGNGLDVIRAARELKVSAAAILVSRFNNERFRQAAQEAGAAFLSKPFETTMLMDLVRSLAPTAQPARVADVGD